MENVVPIRKNVPTENPLETERGAEIARLIEEIKNVRPRLKQARVWLLHAKSSERSADKRANMDAQRKETGEIMTDLSKFQIAQAIFRRRNSSPGSPGNRFNTMLAIAEDNDGVVPSSARAPTVEETWVMVHRAYELLGIDKGEAKILHFPERDKAA